MPNGRAAGRRSSASLCAPYPVTSRIPTLKWERQGVGEADRGREALLFVRVFSSVANLMTIWAGKG
jgi:hypothetical protein